MEMEDGSLGLANIVESSLNLWSKKVNPEEAAEWVLSRVIELKNVIPIAGLEAFVAGFAEGVQVIFVSSGFGLFTIELKSGRVKKIDEPGVYYSVLPYMSFYTPGTVLTTKPLVICPHAFYSFSMFWSVNT
ncbi:hypothetical protein PR202_gb12128 [Eleusine coracana subsp. coracana]|uniref:Uncharacterized protein n=1 Tax=Eleusine coracana subsp. coracana TaxID=191504 RepID=A0AAV5EQ71_ELECO|nr:hypothetical protein PR202_gb12128 [Eleusine coracana subsp. coracana]